LRRDFVGTLQVGRSTLTLGQRFARGARARVRRGGAARVARRL